MLLAIDVGNTQTVVGLFNGHELADHWRIATDADRTSDELALMIQQFLGFHGFSFDNSITGRRDLVGRAARHRRAAPADRALLLAARARRRARRAHRHADPLRQPEGGRRRPHRQRGRRVRPLRRPGDRRRLRHRDHGRGDQRARASTSAARSSPASRSRSTRCSSARPGCGGSSSPRRSTSSASRRSSRSSRARSTGSRREVDGLVDRFVAELGECTVIATGGLAVMILPHARTVQHYEPWLTLYGLRIIFERNQ